MKAWASLCVVTFVLLAGARTFWGSGPKESPDAVPAGGSKVTYRGGLVTPPLPKPRFTLTDTSSARFDFWRKTEGYVTLLFFGYARCPDQCPLHMANIAKALKKMPKGFRDKSSWSLSQLIRRETTPKHCGRGSTFLMGVSSALPEARPPSRQSRRLRGYPPPEKQSLRLKTMQSVTRILFSPTRKTIWPT
jgi:hypothetical protein